MSIEEKRAIVRRFVEEVQSKGNLGVIDEIFSVDYLDHSGLAGSSDLEGTRQFFKMYLAALSDPAVTIHDQIAEGDKVVTRKTLTGTHSGMFMGVPPTGKRISTYVIDIFRVADGKIAEHWMVMDRLDLMQQLGVMPPQGQGKG